MHDVPFGIIPERNYRRNRRRKPYVPGMLPQEWIDQPKKRAEGAMRVFESQGERTRRELREDNKAHIMTPITAEQVCEEIGEDEMKRVYGDAAPTRRSRRGK